MSLVKRPLSERLVESWRSGLARDAGRKARRYLTRERGINALTRYRMKIGWDGKRITIPIRDRSGNLVNVRRHLPNAKPGNKMRNLQGWGSPTRLAFADKLPSESGEGLKGFVLVAGGELDALSAIQAGLLAVCSTNGEGSLPSAEDLEALRGWPVAICLDTDEPGRVAAAKWATALEGVATQVKVVSLPLPKDLNDWFAQHGKTVAELTSVIRETKVWGSRRDTAELLVHAVGLVAGGESRNRSGFWLACQLRDERYNEGEAGEVMMGYQREVADLKSPAYTPEEARNSLQQAYARPARAAVGKAGAGYMLTDLGNAQRFIDRHGDDLRYVSQHGRWYVWDGRRWAVDHTGEVHRWAKSVVRGLQADARALSDEDERKALSAHAARSESASKLKALVSLAETESEVVAVPTDFDRDSMLLNCRNGVVDLRDGTLHDHRREDMCRRIAPVNYDPQATCPTFDAFLARVLPDPAVRSFMQRAVGYSLTGLTTEQKLLLMYGLGANGKTTFVEIVQDLLGDYSQQMPADALLARVNGTIPNDIAKLDGARFVAATEFDDSARINEGLIKQITGGDTISARFLHQEWFDFRPQCTIWVSTNHKPIVRGVDDGIWRRFLLVPFEVQIPEADRDADLPRKLREELPGILRWAVEGALAWQREGLNPPAAVAAATEQYRADSDVLGQFLEDRCEVGTEFSTGKRDLYDAYKVWCRENELKPATMISFGRLVKERGFADDRVGKTKTHVWLGVRVQESALAPYTASDNVVHLRRNEL